jgi:hypothetical protein
MSTLQFECNYGVFNHVKQWVRTFVRQVHLKLRSDDLTIQHLLRLARNACVAVGLHAAPAEVDDNLWLRMDAFDGLGQSARVDDDYDQDVIHSTDLQLVKNLQPKLGVFDLPCPKSEHFLASVGVNRHKFSRHSTAAENTVFRTRPATSHC